MDVSGISQPNTAFSYRRLASLSDRSRLALVLSVALLQGLLFLFLLPPWQHYDEPTHFEQVWLTARLGRRPVPKDVVPAFHREVAASMIAHGFYRGTTPPDLTTEQTPWIGIPEFGHPPAYYWLLSFPVRLVSHLPVEGQLYVARGMSLLLFLLTIGAIAGLVRELTPGRHPLRWAVPLFVALLPPIADIMTAVNNDVGAICMLTLFLWAATRLIRHGFTFWRLLWLFAAALLAPLMKNTASLALVLLPLVGLLAFWVQRGWRWRWLLLLGMAGSGLILGLSFSWGDAAGWYRWYRWAEPVVQRSSTRVTDSKSPLGPYAFQVESTPLGKRRFLINPLLQKDVQQISGQTVTFGAWVWADRTAVIDGPGLLHGLSGSTNLPLETHPMTITTTPTFVAWTFAVPPKTTMVHFALNGIVREKDRRPLQIRFDGAVIARGTFPTDQPPHFDDAARAGTWGGQSFVNLVRNPSADLAGPRLRPWFDERLSAYIHRSPSEVLEAAFDVARMGPVIAGTVMPWVLSRFFTGLSWGQIRLSGAFWPFIWWTLVLLSAVGCLRWLLGRGRHAPRGLRPALAGLALAASLVLLGAMAWSLPHIEPLLVLPAGRYAFPAIASIAFALVGGWWALWPQRVRLAGLTFLLVCIVGLDLLSIWTIIVYYRA